MLAVATENFPTGFLRSGELLLHPAYSIPFFVVRRAAKVVTNTSISLFPLIDNSNSQTSRFCVVSRFRVSTRVPETGPQNPVVSAVSARNEKRLRSRFSTRFSFLFLHLSYRPYMPLVRNLRFLTV